MCLIVNQDLSKTFHKISPKTKFSFSLFKVVRVTPTRLLAPYRSNYVWRAGDHNATGTAYNKAALPREVNTGLHVCLTAAVAERVRTRLADRNRSKKYVTVRVTASSEDLIAVGSHDGMDANGHAVFSKVHLDADEITRVLPPRVVKKKVVAATKKKPVAKKR